MVETRMSWITKAWEDELDSLTVETAVPSFDVKRPSWWRESVNEKIGWNEKQHLVEAGAQVAYYGPPVEPPCPTDGLQRDHQVPWENALRSGLAFAPEGHRESCLLYTSPSPRD